MFISNELVLQDICIEKTVFRKINAKISCQAKIQSNLKNTNWSCRRRWKAYLINLIDQASCDVG